MIYLDVNPSITIEINKNEKVLNVVANNADGEKILDDMDLKHTDLDTAVNALIGSMVKYGYLSDAQNMILVSVDGKDAQYTETLRTELSDDIYESVQALIGSGAVLDQRVTANDTLKELAKTYGISPGKAWLISLLTDANPDLKAADLAALPISELAVRLKEAGIDLREYVNYHGLDDDWFDFDDIDDTDSDDALDELIDDHDDGDHDDGDEYDDD